MLDIQLPAIYRARSAALDGEDVSQVDDTAGLLKDHVFAPSARRLRTVPAGPASDDDDRGFDLTPVSTEDDIVSIDELLVWARTEERRPIDTRIRRLASLLGIAAAAIVVLILVFAAGTDIPSVFRSLPGS